MCNEHIQGDEGGTYVALERAASPERGMAYRARAPRSRSPRSSLGWGEPTTWRRGTGGRHMNGGRVRDAHRPEPKCLSSTGELIDIERVTISLEGGRWKSIRLGNSLAAYPTSYLSQAYHTLRETAPWKHPTTLPRPPSFRHSCSQAWPQSLALCPLR